MTIKCIYFAELMNIQQRDLLYSRLHNYIVDYGLWLHKWRIYHMNQDMDLYTVLLSMPSFLGIQH